MTAQDKLDHVLNELKRITLPDETVDSKKFWERIGYMCENSVDEFYDMDKVLKQLIEFIEK